MKANFAKRLQNQIKAKLPPGAAKYLNLHYIARSHIHQALKRAQDSVARFGYYLGIVRDTGSMVSAKLYSPTTDRDYSKPPKALSDEFGFPINLQISATDQGVTIYSYRHSGGTATIVTSTKSKEIEDAIYKELETQISAGVDFLMQNRKSK